MKLRCLSGWVALSTAGVMACSAHGPVRPPPRNNIVTGDEIMRTGAQTAYAALQRIRPNWLTSRGPTSLTNPTPSYASVYINGVDVGDISYLKQVNVVDVLTMRFYRATEAGARFGRNHPGGVIAVTTK